MKMVLEFYVFSLLEFLKCKIYFKKIKVLVVIISHVVDSIHFSFK